MIVIVLSACMANDPQVCKDYKIPVNEGLDAMQCALYAPPHFAKWSDEHPGWMIKKWRCTSATENDI